MDAMVFDFDGVLADSEPIHLKCFRQVLGLIGVELNEQDYYDKYVGYDDRGCFRAVLADRGLTCDEPQIKAMIEAKSKIVQRVIAESVRPLAGSVELVRSAAEARIPLAICSGALRREILLAVEAIGLGDAFSQIVSAEDVARGKPDPAGYRLAVARLSASAGRELRPARTIAVEDSPAGIDSAKAAGLKVLAVTNSCPGESLQAADRIVSSLEEVAVSSLDELL